MTICKSCLLSDMHPAITFDSQNVCSFCRNFSTSPPFKYKGKTSLMKLLAQLKSARRNHEFDCLLGLSGGRDSSYLAYRAVHDWDLRPLAYCYDNGHMPAEIKQNIKKVVQKLGIKLIYCSNEVEKNRKLFKALFDAWINRPHAGMIQTFCIGCRGGINKFIPKLCQSDHITHLLDGSNFYEDTSYKLALFGIHRNDTEAFRGGGELNKIHRQLVWAIANQFARNLHYAKPAIIINGISDFLHSFKPKAQVIYPFYYEKYEEEKVITTITRELDWHKPTYAPSSWRADCDLAMVKNYLHLKLLGFSDYDLFFSNLIRGGIIDRNTGKKRLQAVNRILLNSTQKIVEILKSYNLKRASVEMFQTLTEKTFTSVKKQPISKLTYNSSSLSRLTRRLSEE
ncbi:MAG: putative ATPase of the PP-loop superfamily implicated in cell cycle control [Promethearchaeota archaeon CR_4]|nr:MAG: putative ATPase of the PP-loop superfamily implicated in cell cycle control [Candidatus Lokiarchaeota archaeon CR_4]